MTWEVRAETHDGGEVVLRRLATRDEAESYPIRLSLWRRVWVSEVSEKPEKPAATLRRPWVIDEPHHTPFTYLRDADGARIATLHGRNEQRDRMIGILRQVGLLGEES